VDQQALVGLSNGFDEQVPIFPTGESDFREQTRQDGCYPLGPAGDVHSEVSKVAPQVRQKGERSHIRVTEVPEGHNKNIYLKIMFSLNKDGVRYVDECYDLIETGAEVCLIRQGLLLEFLFQPAENHLRLIAVNTQRLAGGDKEVLITMVISGIHMIDKKAVEMRIPTGCTPQTFESILFYLTNGVNSEGLIFRQESTGCFASNQAKNSGSTVCVSQQPTNQTLSSVLWSGIGCGRAALHPSPVMTSPRKL